MFTRSRLSSDLSHVLPVAGRRRAFPERALRTLAVSAQRGRMTLRSHWLSPPMATKPPPSGRLTKSELTLAPYLQRAGIDLPRATTARWMIHLGALITPLIKRLRGELLGYDVVQMHETRIQVLKEDGREPSSQSFMWGQRGGPPGRAVILFHYDPSRGQDPATALLTGYRGYLQCDGYEVYATIAAKSPAIRLIGCFATPGASSTTPTKARASSASPARPSRTWT